jgi:spore coat protein U-like protein
LTRNTVSASLKFSSASAIGARLHQRPGVATVAYDVFKNAAENSALKVVITPA